MSSSIYLLEINIYFSQFQRVHSTADIDTDDIRYRFIGDGHCGADRTAFSGMNVGHNPYLRSCCEIMIAHSADLFDGFILYNGCITNRCSYFTFDFKHCAAPFVLVTRHH